MSDSLEGLAEPFASKARQLIDRIERLGLPFRPEEGRRSFSRSAALYMEGRAVVAGVVTVVDRSKVVSNAVAGTSPHNYGLALDAVLILNPHPYWDGDVGPTGPWDDGKDKGVLVRGAVQQAWLSYGRAVRDSGLVWGGDWGGGIDGSGFHDLPHAELPRWESLRPPNWQAVAAQMVSEGK